MKTLRSRGSDIDPAICLPGHEDALEVLRLGYQSAPGRVRAGKLAVFVHPKLQLHGNDNHFAAFGQARQGGVSFENFMHLIQIDIKRVPVKVALTALQALLVHLATFFLSSDQDEQADAKDYLHLLSEWTQTLLASAQTRMVYDQSPWQQWLFGESIRRTIIMSYVLSLALSGFEHGYCSNWLFVESLPFDRRAGLWMSESPQAWIAAARARSGEDVGERLTSFHEFAETQKDSDPDFGDDMFLILLTFGHNGAKRMHELRPGGN